MSDEPTSHPDAPAAASPPEPRAQPYVIEPPPRRRSWLPLFFVLGFVVLAGAIAWLWTHPAQPPEFALQSARFADLEQHEQSLDERVQRLAQIQAGLQAVTDREHALAARVDALGHAPHPASVDLGPIEARVAALEKQVSQPPSGLQALSKRVDDLTNRVTAQADAARQTTTALQDRLSALEAQLKSAAGEVSGARDAAATAVKQSAAAQQQADAAQQQAAQAEKLANQVPGMLDKAQRLAQIQAAQAALAAGRPLGTLPNAPPALSRFAAAKPPTEAELRLSFPVAAAAARQASEPDLQGKPLLDRMLARAEQALTVRQGSHVIIGDPAAGILEAARERVDAGDLAGAVLVLDKLQGPAAAAMADWVDQAKQVLAARAALTDLAEHG